MIRKKSTNWTTRLCRPGCGLSESGKRAPPARRRGDGGAARVQRAAILAVLLALPASGEPAANGWEHAGIPYEALIAALAYDDPDTRKRAAHSLGHRGQKEAVPHLLAALAKPEPDHGVRSRIYLALGRLGEQASAPALFECLDREGREELRGDCAAALGGVRSGRARDRLIAMLGGDEHVLVKRRAVDALGRYGDPAAVDALAAVALRDGGKRDRLRRHAIAALGATGHPDAAAPLLTLLDRAADEADALPVVIALGRSGGAAARAPLAALLERARGVRLRTALALALAAVGDRDTAAAMTRLLADPAPPVQLAAIRALRSHGGREHAASVAAYASGLAARLFDGGTRDAAGALVDASLLEAALATLTALDAAHGEGVLLDAARLRAGARETTADIVIANALYRVRRGAIYGLGYTGSDGAAAFLAGPEGLSDPDSRLRAAAIRSVAVLGKPGAAAAILGALDDPRAEVRIAAAGALGRLGEGRAVAPLIGSLDDRHAQVRRRAAESLGYLADPAARPALKLRAEGDESPVVRKAARFALSLL